MAAQIAAWFWTRPLTLSIVILDQAKIRKRKQPAELLKFNSF
jgi:hypothetical protein